jgi:aminoglycoside phosphotransferase (APT) family kinase protein
MYKLGAELAVRLPRRVAVTKLIEHEQHWLPQLAPLLPIAVPAPVRIGLPAENYPSRWSGAWMRGHASAMRAARRGPTRPSGSQRSCVRSIGLRPSMHR